MRNGMKSVAILGALLVSGTVLAAKVDRREARQQARIEQGEKSGQLTQKEASQLERREARIDEQKRAERAANGGKLTPAERRQLNREQNRTSRAIYNKKHNAQTQPGVAPAQP